ncbi:MAG: tRNA uridine(34) 5-carboxymethylaminomethyl modification radical SAM/GNAT enzyme Elp3 [Candidatus Nealsonbacteria bacterium]|nr:tRNA uridine(34) 5-carboxymethylaminomethyl modification radical SAM/GNAT enzyme Elp3 [Candidatus Nealsonbacteria bacterium]
MNTAEIMIMEIMKNRLKTPEDLASVKRKMSKKYKVPCPSNIKLLETYRKMLENKKIKKTPLIEKLLRTRPVRSLSGIVNISVLTKPYPCPGKCIYCPTEKGIPKSYVSGEPAVERAKKLNFDPYLQVKKRIETLEMEGHPTDKIELRIVGGTWSYYPKKYQEWFIKRCFESCNNGRTSGFRPTQRFNERARHRIVGLSIETRPDFINLGEIKWLRELGVTMVELGVQSIYDDVLKFNNRGHGVKEISEATKLLKNAGFKILYQMMPNLPGSTSTRDLKMFGELSSDFRFKPDLLKIYPCALVKGAPLYKLWKNKKYKPYTEKQLINLVKSIKKIIPYYVRIQRITRDIPSHSIAAGPAKISNLRQIVSGNCKCIRCREVGANYDPKEKLYLFRQDYNASGGKEIFLSFENKNRSKLYSLLRLRLCNGSYQLHGAVIRELHTYGQSLEVWHPSKFGGGRTSPSPQHKGLGRKLIKEAEKISEKEFGFNKITVISGIGARDYYRKLGYRLENTYMVKKLR